MNLRVRVILFATLFVLMTSLFYFDSTRHIHANSLLENKFAQRNNFGPPLQGNCTNPPSGSFVLDNLQLWYSNADWSPNGKDPNKPGGNPNAIKGKLLGVARMNQGCRFIRAKATRLRWTTENKNWILANNNNNNRRTEIIVHAFKQDSNDGCLYITTKAEPLWIESNLDFFERVIKSGCIFPGYSNNEGRVVVTRPDLLDTSKNYSATFWWNDDGDRDLGEVPLAFGWQNLNHQDVLPDDNVKKFCFGADESKSWGVSALPPWNCANGAPVRLYPFPDWLGTSEGFTGRDNYLANNPIGDNIALSIRLFAGWRARLYTEPNYTGQSQLIDADDPDLSDNIVGTSTTSIDASTLGVAVYDQPSFGSTEHIFSGCDNDLSDNPIGENRISSVRIPPGWRLKLWEGKNKTGKKVVIQGIENADLADTIDNLASSLCADTPQDQESAGETEDWTTE